METGTMELIFGFIGSALLISFIFIYVNLTTKN